MNINNNVKKKEVSQIKSRKHGKIKNFFTKSRNIAKSSCEYETSQEIIAILTKSCNIMYCIE